MRTFPEDFLWGAMVSAHRAEGGNFNNDWWRWEQRPQRILDGSTSARAADHYNRFDTDFGLARKLGHNAVLLSVEWSRIQPAPDVFDQDSINHYVAVLDALKGHGLTAVCVLHEVTRPVWFAEMGGWDRPDAPQYFGRYVDRVAPVLATRCGWWLPIYEPEHTVLMQLVEGAWPGGPGSARRAARWLHHMAQAQAGAATALHGVAPDCRVGVSVRARRYHPFDPNSAWDTRAAQREQRRGHHRFLDLLRAQAGGMVDVDFIGVSYYGAQHVRFSPLRLRRSGVQVVNEDGKAVFPDLVRADPHAFRECLDEFRAYDVPLLISGNGMATEQDERRCAYLLDHLHVLGDCIAAGIDVRGYFYRSLLDSFEWTYGYRARYGMVHVDWDTQARTPNNSAFLFKDVCETGELRRGAVERFCPDWDAARLEAAP